MVQVFPKLNRELSDLKYKNKALETPGYMFRLMNKSLNQT